MENWLSNLGAAELKWEEESEGGRIYTSPPFSSMPHISRDFDSRRAETRPGMRASHKILASDIPERKGETNVLMAGSGSSGTRGSMEGGGWSQVKNLRKKAGIFFRRLGISRKRLGDLKQGMTTRETSAWEGKVIWAREAPPGSTEGGGRAENGLLKFLGFPGRNWEPGQ